MTFLAQGLNIFERCPVAYAAHLNETREREKCRAAPAGCCRLSAFGAPEHFGCTRLDPVTKYPDASYPAGKCSTHPNSTAAMPLGQCACPSGLEGAHCEKEDTFWNTLLGNGTAGPLQLSPPPSYPRPPLFSPR